MENNSQTAPTNKTKEYERLFHGDGIGGIDL